MVYANQLRVPFNARLLAHRSASSNMRTENLASVENTEPDAAVSLPRLRGTTSESTQPVPGFQFSSTCCLQADSERLHLPCSQSNLHLELCDVFGSRRRCSRLHLPARRHQISTNTLLNGRYQNMIEVSKMKANLWCMVLSCLCRDPFWGRVPMHENVSPFPHSLSDHLILCIQLSSQVWCLPFQPLDDVYSLDSDPQFFF